MSGNSVNNESYGCSTWFYRNIKQILKKWNMVIRMYKLEMWRSHMNTVQGMSK